MIVICGEIGIPMGQEAPNCCVDWQIMDGVEGVHEIDGDIQTLGREMSSVTFL